VVADALIVLGCLAALVGIVLCARDNSEVGTKWIGVGIGLLAVGTLLTRIL
jgi:hypothetical protein